MTTVRRMKLRPVIPLSVIALGIAVLGLFFALSSGAQPCAQAASGSCPVGDLEIAATGYGVDEGGSSSTVATAIAARSGETHALIAPSLSADRVSTLPDYAGEAVIVSATHTAGQIIRSSGSGSIPTWATIEVHKTADETVSASTTLQNDDHLVFALDASSQYALTGVLLVNSGAAPDFKWQVSLPAGATVDGHTVTNSSGTIGAFTEAAADVFDTTGNDDAAAFWAVVKVAGTSGNLTIQWAQNASDAGATTLKTGSWINLVKLN